MKNAIELFSSTPSLLKIGSGEIKKIYVGNKDVTSMYIGNTLVYSLGDTPNIPTPPITDGLTCWLDARSLSNFAYGETWADLSGNGNNGSIAEAQLVSLENGILDCSGYINVPNTTKGLSDYTVEVGFKDLSTGYWLGLWGNTSGSTGNSAYRDNGFYNGYPVPITVEFLPKTEREYYTVVVKDNRADIYFNGLLLSKNCCTLTPSDAKYFVFMARKPNNATQDTNGGADVKRAEWYFLRIYDRALTADEVMSNYTYETSLNRGTSNV